MADLPGPKLRMGELMAARHASTTGAVQLCGPTTARRATHRSAASAHPEVRRGLEVGDRVLLADGAAELRVIEVDGNEVRTEVVNGGLIRCALRRQRPSQRLARGEADRGGPGRPCRSALELRVDLIAQSFVRTADDVSALRALLPADGPRLVVKVETRAGGRRISMP